jgi:glycosyltransferase involved in cell wall biosynthesis
MRLILAHNFYRQPGGEDASFQAQADLLRVHGHDVFTFTRHNADVEHLGKIRSGINMIWSRSSVESLSGLIEQTKPELVHFHNTFMQISPAAYYACRKHQIPVIQDLRNYRLLCPVATFFRDGHPCEDCLGKTPPWPGVIHSCWRNSKSATALVATMLTTHRLLGTWHNYVDRYIALTEGSKAKFIEGGLPAHKIDVKPNFVTARMNSQTKKKEFALFVGRLSGEKGISTLLEAWRKVNGLKLVIAGDGPLADEVMKEQQHSSGKMIEWLGQIGNDEVRRIMSEAQMLIFPSIWHEPFGNSIIEAFSSGLPVIASNTGSMVELVKHGKTGLHFRVGEPNDLVDKVTWARANTEKMREMGANARKEYEKKYTPDKNYQLLMNIYEKTLKSYASGGKGKT